MKYFYFLLFKIILILKRKTYDYYDPYPNYFGPINSNGNEFNSNYNYGLMDYKNKFNEKKLQSPSIAYVEKYHKFNNYAEYPKLPYYLGPPRVRHDYYPTDPLYIRKKTLIDSNGYNPNPTNFNKLNTYGLNYGVNINRQTSIDYIINVSFKNFKLKFIDLEDNIDHLNKIFEIINTKVKNYLIFKLNDIIWDYKQQNVKIKSNINKLHIYCMSYNNLKYPIFKLYNVKFKKINKSNYSDYNIFKIKLRMLNENNKYIIEIINENLTEINNSISEIDNKIYNLKKIYDNSDNSNNKWILNKKIILEIFNNIKSINERYLKFWNNIIFNKSLIKSNKPKFLSWINQYIKKNMFIILINLILFLFIIF